MLAKEKSILDEKKKARAHANVQAQHCHMAAAAAPYITRTSRGGGSSSLHHVGIMRIMRTSLLHSGITRQRRTAAPYS
ncbi:hypothetical protein STEG23_019274 [Scotinomys teguina]